MNLLYNKIFGLKIMILCIRFIPSNYCLWKFVIFPSQCIRPYFFFCFSICYLYSVNWKVAFCVICWRKKTIPFLQLFAKLEHNHLNNMLLYVCGCLVVSDSVELFWTSCCCNVLVFLGYSCCVPSNECGAH